MRFLHAKDKIQLESPRDCLVRIRWAFKYKWLQKWCFFLKEGCQNVVDEPRSGRLSTTATEGEDDIVAAFPSHI